MPKHIDKIGFVPSSTAPSTPIIAGKQGAVSEHSAILSPVSSAGHLSDQDVDVLADDLAKGLHSDGRSSDSSRHSSPGRSAVRIAVAVKSRRSAAAPLLPPSVNIGTRKHTYDEQARLLCTDGGTYVMGQPVGKGSFGEIVQAVAPLGHPVVVKVVDMTDDLKHAGDESARAAVVKKHRREFAAMSRANSRYQPLDMARVGNKLFIVLPPLRVHVADEGLRVAMDTRSRPHVANCMFHDICADLARAHAQGWLHRDLKLENFMTDMHGRVVLIDFGEAMALPARNGALIQYDSFCNAEYFAPETYLAYEESLGAPNVDKRGERIDTKASEMFAMGLCWATLATKRDTHPFESTPEVHRAWLDSVHAMLPVDAASGLIDREALEVLATKSNLGREEQRLCTFVADMCRADWRMGSYIALHVMHRDPQQRPTADQAREHSSPTQDDVHFGRELLQLPLASERIKQVQAAALLQKHEALKAERVAAR